MHNNFRDKVALVTGGGGGIGRATALAFSRAGARVAVVDISLAAARATVALIEGEGGAAMLLQTDVTQAAAVEAMVAAVVGQWGRLDCAFNNAGIEEEHVHFADADEATFDRIMNVNVKGVFLCMKYQLRQMMLQGGGSIVNTASVAGLIGAPKMASYAGSKHAVIGLTKTAAIEYGRKKVRVNAVCPGVIRTAMFDRAVELDPRIAASVVAAHPVGRIGEAEEVAAAVLWLSSDAASFVTGLAHTVDGGMTAA